MLFYESPLQTAIAGQAGLLSIKHLRITKQGWKTLQNPVTHTHTHLTV